ncbi:thiamine pyrophosphate-dependent enzyme [Geoglobus acetivorans]|uniref:Pyruvate ferredoxin oxidoreductase, beta subunit n=1 Tax=Geoglobus acetivorans TaxID=565033 RepID=A0A0A7GFL2_GEOAI|nr:pyruvate ferredoxin oxidoreductase, beta subunit [Geoglobus acetivorans]
MILPGNASCQGCPISIAFKALDEIDNPVLVIPAGCSTVIAGMHPVHSLKCPVVHVPFASTTAVAAGLRESYRKQGVDATVVAWMGDGAADIGFSTLSASASRNDDLLVIVVDNEAYMNTGTQSSLATPYGAVTTTTPAGKKTSGRDLGLIMLSHKVSYVATASVGYMKDLRRKFRKAGRMEGFRFIHVHAPCPPGWRFDASMTVDVARLAVETLAWILWEYDGRLRISELSRRAAINRRDLKEYFGIQGRFKAFDDDNLKRIALEIEEKYRILEHLESEHQ